MSADNWTICPKCVQRIKDLKEAFIKKYYGKLDGVVYGKILTEINKSVEYINSYSEKEYEPDKEILKLMEDKEISVECYGQDYDADDLLTNKHSSCSLREDYQQGVSETGMAYFSYSCSCDCGFSKRVEFDENSQKIESIK